MGLGCQTLSPARTSAYLTAEYFSCLNLPHWLLSELFLIFCLVIFVLFSPSCPTTNWTPTEKKKHRNRKLKNLVQDTNVSEYIVIWQLTIHAIGNTSEYPVVIIICLQKMRTKHTKLTWNDEWRKGRCFFFVSKPLQDSLGLSLCYQQHDTGKQLFNLFVRWFPSSAKTHTIIV